MKKILVPTDFSKNSRSAFLYALKLAEQLQAEITVVHVYHPSANHMNELMVITDSELEKIAEERLDRYVDENIEMSFKGILIAAAVEKKIEIGFAADKLVEMSKSGDYDMIIMGATGSTGMLEKVFGKVSLHVARWASCPVLLIPAGVVFQPIKEIMFASEYESTNVNVLLQLQELSRNIDANIHLVHVYNEDEKQTEGVEHFLLEKEFQLNVPSLKFSMESIESNSVARGLEEYAQNNEMDWMVLVKPQRNLWQRLIHKSETNEIVMNPQIPLMVMH